MTAQPSEQGGRRPKAQIKPGWIVPSDDVDLTGLSARRWAPFTKNDQRIIAQAKANQRNAAR